MVNRRRTSDDIFALHVASGKTILEACKLVGISESTGNRRMADKQFRQRVETIQGEMVQRALAVMTDSLTTAATELKKLVAGAKGETSKIAAIRLNLDCVARLRENTSFEKRLAALEANANANELATAETPQF